MKYSRFLIYIPALCVIVYSLYSLFRIVTTTAPDFSVYYQSAQNLISGRNMYTDTHLYTSYSYPPVTAFLYIPLTLLPYQLAQGMFSILSYVSLYGVIYYCFRLFNVKLSRGAYVGAITLALLSFPVKFTFGMGQINIIALFSLLFGMYAFLNLRKQKGAFFIALAMVLKPQLVVILLVMFLYKKYRLSLHIFLWTVGITVFETLCFGITPWVQYILQKIPETLRFTSDSAIYYNQGILAFAGRIAQGKEGMLIYVLLGFLLIVTYGMVLMKHKNDANVLQLIALVLPLLLLIEPLSWQHHYVFLIPSFFWLLTHTKMNAFHYFILFIIYISVSVNLQPVINAHTTVLFQSHVGIATSVLYGIMIGVSLKKQYDI